MRFFINFKHLECFLELAEKQNFSEVAKSLSTSQPAVSQQIRSLEEVLGKQLFVRTSKSVVLTRHGQDFLKQTKSLFNELCQRMTNFRDSSEALLQGELNFASLEEVGERVFVPLLSEFKKRHERLKINIKLLKGFEILELLKRGDIDVGIVSDQITSEGVRCYKVYVEEILLVTNKKNASRDLESYNDLPFVTYRENDPLRDYYFQKVFPRSKKGRHQAEMTVNSHKAMTHLLLNQPYYAVLPRFSIESELLSGALVDVGPKVLKSPLYMVHLESDFLDEKTVQITKFIRERLKV